MCSVAIHQAHYLPWVPYFALLSSVETFVVLDDVQYKTRYYINRTKIVNKDTGELVWVSIPTTGTQSTITKDVLISRDRFFNVALNKIRHNYRHTPYFEYWSEIEMILRDKSNTHLLHLNVQLLQHILNLIGLNIPNIKLSSQILKVAPKCRTHRYALICEAIGSSKILSGVGMAKDVHDINKLVELGIEFIAMKKEAIVEHSIEYGVSIIDTLLSEGPDKTRRKIERFSRSAFELIRSN